MSRLTDGQARPSWHSIARSSWRESILRPGSCSRPSHKRSPTPRGRNWIAWSGTSRGSVGHRPGRSGGRSGAQSGDPRVPVFPQGPGLAAPLGDTPLITGKTPQRRRAPVVQGNRRTVLDPPGRPQGGYSGTCPAALPAGRARPGRRAWRRGLVALEHVPLTWNRTGPRPPPSGSKLSAPGIRRLV